MQYPKIQTLWKRDLNTGLILEGHISCPEFDSIKTWRVSEKVDGTNIRIYFNPAKNTIEIKGRTEKSDIPKFLMETLTSIFTTKNLLQVFPEEKEVVLYGEGYGNKIQGVGNKYRNDNSFCLFDVVIDGWWLERDNVFDIANKLNIDVAPDLGVMLKEEIIDLVKGGFTSHISQQPLLAEGVVVRSEPLMLFRDGNPIMWKLKTTDYQKLKKLKMENKVLVSMTSTTRNKKRFKVNER